MRHIKFEKKIGAVDIKKLKNVQMFGPGLGAKPLPRG
jgi:hypothetical protein